MTFNANGLFTLTPGPEYNYRKILKAANKLRSDVLMVQETDINGLVDWQVSDVEHYATRYGFSLLWLYGYAGTYLKGGMLMLLKTISWWKIMGKVAVRAENDYAEHTRTKPGGGQEGFFGRAV